MIKTAETLLPTNKYTRSGEANTPRGVVLHYPDAPGWTAAKLRGYIEGLPRTEPGRYASYHIAIGLDGERIRMIPDNEVAWHAGPSAKTSPRVKTLLGGLPNWRTIGVCFCHHDSGGAFTRATWQSAVETVAEILTTYQIGTAHVLRHHDCTGKRCPAWFVDHPAEWKAFLDDVDGVVKKGRTA